MQVTHVLVPCLVEFEHRSIQWPEQISLETFASSGSVATRLTLLKESSVVDGSISAAEHVVVPFGLFLRHFGACERRRQGDIDGRIACVDDDTLGEELRKDGSAAYLSQVPVRPDLAEAQHPSCQGLDPPGANGDAPLVLSGELLAGVLTTAVDALTVQAQQCARALGGKECTGTFVACDVNLWASAGMTTSSCHYDEHDNLLVVCTGTKTVALAPPQAADIPAFNAASVASASPNHAAVDLLSPALPPSLSVIVQTVTVRAGHALIIPSGWWHQVHSEQGTVALNVWARFQNDTRGRPVASPSPFVCAPVCMWWVRSEHMVGSALYAAQRQASIGSLQRRVAEKAKALMASIQAADAAFVGDDLTVPLLRACGAVVEHAGTAVDGEIGLLTRQYGAPDQACVQLVSVMLRALSSPSLLCSWWHACERSQPLYLVSLCLAWEYLTDAHVQQAVQRMQGTAMIPGMEHVACQCLDSLFTAWWSAVGLSPSLGARAVATAVEVVGRQLLEDLDGS